MNDKNVNEFNNFINMYKQGEIIYPSAVARHLSVSVKEVYQICDKESTLHKIYLTCCPVCRRNVNRYQAISDIPEYENCPYCDREFLTSKGFENAIVCYEKGELND